MEIELKSLFPYISNQTYNYDKIISGKTKEQLLELSTYAHEINYNKPERGTLDEWFNSYIKWRLDGRNIFDFNENLLALLKNTRVPTDDLNSIKLPFDSIFIPIKNINSFSNSTKQYVGNGFKIDFNDSIIKDIGINGVYIHIDRALVDNITRDHLVINFTYNINAKMALHAYLEDLDYGGFKGLDLDPTSYLLYDIYDDSKIFENWVDGAQYVPPPTNACNYASFLKGMIVILEQRLNHNWKGIYPPQITEYVHDNLYVLIKILPTVINCLLYLSTPQSKETMVKFYPSSLPFNYNKKLLLSTQKKQIKKIEDQINIAGYSKVKYIGREYECLNIKAHGSEKQAHWRRGHWRNQPFGIRNLNHKLIWIKPMMINRLEIPQVKGHIYDV